MRRRSAWALAAAAAAFLTCTWTVGAAEAQGVPDLYGDGLELVIDEENDLYIRFLTWHQVWLRAMQMSPGSVVDGSTDEWQTDVMLRRARFLFYAQLTDRVLILTHFGINNQTFTNGGAGSDAFRPQLFFHDVYVELRALDDDHLYVGAGLLYWNGVSRMSSASTLNLLGLDAPILNWPNVDLTDQFARQLGLYAKGEIGGFHYRVQLTRPFVRDTPVFVTPAEATPTSTFNAHANSWALSGYFNYDFFDKESHTLPFFVGSYLGTKRVLNVGAGFAWQHHAMVHCAEAASPGADCPAADRRPEDMLLLGLDAFLDLPIEEGALTSYLVYYYHDYGPDYVRDVGIANLTGGASGSGPGSAYPSIGTGSHIYWQLGYMLPFRPWGLHRITPYLALQASFMEALDDPSLVYELGLKYHLLGHHATVTFHWRNRPVFGSGERDPATGEVTFVPSATQEDRGNDVIVQLMIYL